MLPAGVDARLLLLGCHPMGSFPAPKLQTEFLLMNELSCSAEACEQPLAGQYLRCLLSCSEGLLLPDRRSLRVSRELQVCTAKTAQQGRVCAPQPPDLSETQVSEDVDHQISES